LLLDELKGTSVHPIVMRWMEYAQTKRSESLRDSATRSLLKIAEEMMLIVSFPTVQKSETINGKLIDGSVPRVWSSGSNQR